jgi:hypothetical protein
MIYKEIDSINNLEILLEYKKIENQINWFDNKSKGKQCGLQYASGEDFFHSAGGKLKKDRKENEYCLLNPLFKDTIFENIISKYKLFRTRLMWIHSFACYSIHKDSSPRLHIPVLTNNKCLFVFPDESKMFYLPPGKVYLVDTTLHHSFCNFSEHSRLHLVGCVGN